MARDGGGSGGLARRAMDYARGESTLQESLLSTVLGSLVPDSSAQSPAEAPGRPVPPPASGRAAAPLSLPILTQNFRKFSSRVGTIFIVRDFLESVFMWQNAFKTLTFMALFTLSALHPSMIPVLPLLIVLFNILIPAFERRHELPSGSSVLEMHLGLEDGEPLRKPAQLGRPVEGRDFVMNMRDIQNLMADYTSFYDWVMANFVRYVDFSDEYVSSTVLIGCIGGAFMVALVSYMVPFNLVVLMLGWAAVLYTHPEASRFVQPPEAAQSSLSRVVENLRHVSHRDIDIGASKPKAVRVFGYAQDRADAVPKFFSACETLPEALQSQVPSLELVRPPKGFYYVDRSWSVRASEGCLVDEPDNVYYRVEFTRRVLPLRESDNAEQEAKDADTTE